MDRQAILNGIEALQELVTELGNDGVNDRAAYTRWRKVPKNFQYLERVFGYDQLPVNPARPKVNEVFRINFHPVLPLVILNYTQVAHNELHHMQEAWTWPLRLCRGIVFDLQTSRLVALPLIKFFNYGGHEETRNLPQGECEVTCKYDGHLGIIFRYCGKFLVTTRGDFTSETSQLAQVMLDRYVKKNRWAKKFPEYLTVLVEIIDPKTKIHVDYGSRSEFILIGAMRSDTGKIFTMIEAETDETIDYNYDELQYLGQKVLGLPVTESFKVTDWSDVLTEVQKRTVHNREGFVARFADGKRAKFKYVNHVGLMVAKNLSLTYLMNRALNDELEDRLNTLSEEAYAEAIKMLGQISVAMFGPGTAKDKWRKLYELKPKVERTTNYEKICRKFAQRFTRNPQIEVAAMEFMPYQKKG